MNPAILRKHHRASPQPRKILGITRRSLEQMDRQTLIGTLDREVSDYVRMKSLVDGGGWTRCITCERPLAAMKFDCGHYITRARLSTRWDMRNLKPQCKKCNRFNEGVKHVFRQKLVAEYGADVVEQLERKASEPCFISDPELVDMIKAYRSSNRVLKNKIKEYQ